MLAPVGFSEVPKQVGQRFPPPLAAQSTKRVQFDDTDRVVVLGAGQQAEESRFPEVGKGDLPVGEHGDGSGFASSLFQNQTRSGIFGRLVRCGQPGIERHDP